MRNTITEQTRESRLRRVALRQHLTLTRSRTRDPRAIGYGKYALLGGDGKHARFAFTIDEIERILNGDDPA